MTTYMIVTAKMKDRDAFIQGYDKVTAPLDEKFGSRYVLSGSGATLLEGKHWNGASMLISEWSDREAVERFWNSAEYQEAKKHREGIASCQALIIDAPKFAKD